MRMEVRLRLLDCHQHMRDLLALEALLEPQFKEREVEDVQGAEACTPERPVRFTVHEDAQTADQPHRFERRHPQLRLQSVMFADHRGRPLADRLSKLLDRVEVGDLRLRLGDRHRYRLKLLIGGGLGGGLQE